MNRYIAHALAAVLIAAPLALAYLAPDVYDPLMEEDRAVEWATVVLFLTAGVARCYRAVRGRRVFDLLVGAFCLFVAGEEISWGQRLIGFTPPDLFLAHNTQQEANVHNFADLFGRPKWILIMSLAGYGLLLPVLASAPPTRRLLDRVGATAPPRAVAPWFLVAITLLVWYPVTFTGEWVELLSGWLFLAAAPLSATAAGLTAVAALPIALAMTWISAVRLPGDGSELTCARAEVDALLADIAHGQAAAPDLDEVGSLHKRVWSSVASGYVERDQLRQFRAAACGTASAESLGARRAYGVDPWGTAYWLHVTRDGESGARRVVVYSFGPNRRRDGEPGATTGDDIAAEGVRR